MSWRFIFAVLLIAAGASAWGGMRLGDWLIAHGPEKAILHNEPPVSKVPVLDANGLPYVAQPPQPLADGRMGVPEPPAPVDWAISADQSAAQEPNLTIALATTSISMDEAKLIASSGGNGSSSANLAGIADVSNLGLGGKSQGAKEEAAPKPPLQPVDVPPPPPPPEPTMPRNWQAEFQHELKVCGQESFFDRPSCAWAARNKYCGANDAWGKVRDCPAKSF